MEIASNVGCYIKFIGKEFEKSKVEHLKEFNLTSSQMNVIMCIARHEKENINQKYLEQKLNLSNATVSGILKRLETKKIICKRFINNKKDKFIFLDNKGLEIKNKLLKDVKHFENQLLNDFTKEEKTTLFSYLNRIKKNIKGGQKDD